MKDSFADALGSRFWATDPDGSAVEFFRLSLPFSSGTAAEARRVARARRLSTFSPPGFAPIRRIERVPGAADQLAIVSTAVPGVRLSDLLRRGAEKGITPSPGVVRNLGRQIVRAMADFHRAFPDLAHGALGPERVVVGPDGRAVIVEYVLAPALELLGMNRVAFWRTFRIAVPPSAGAVRFDQVTDVVQLGMVMLALVLGRPIGRDEYPCEIEPPLSDGSSPSVELLSVGSPAMRAWLLRAGQPQIRSAFRTAVEAAAAFEEVVADEPRHKSLPSAVVAYLQSLEPDASRPPAMLPAPRHPL